MKINKDLAISESGFIFNPITGESFTANEVGVSIINQLKLNKNKEEIISFLDEEYNSDKNSLEKDYDDFISILHRLNLIIS